MARLRLCIFHYHLLPGGVTDVIIAWARILAGYSETIFPQYQRIELKICCGNPENVAELQALDFGSRLALVEFVVDPKLGYWQDATEISANLITSFEQHLRAEYYDEEQDNLWWIHNYHLGKNPVYTQAVLRIIRCSQLQNLRFLLHIHDFPECGRFALYEGLSQAQRDLEQPDNSGSDGIADLYPVSAKVCYGTINKRDLRILRDAGLPGEQLFFLPNPLEFRDLCPKNRPHKRETLRMEFNRSFGLPDAMVALYPVRCIRRKNILELALLNVLSEHPWNLISTLPGRSPAEQPYSQLVEELYETGIIQGRCNVGLELEAKGWSFDMLCWMADFIVSSSVMEGFGFAYFNAMYWNKYLLARHLDVLEGFEHCFAPNLALFYHELKIPLRKLDGTIDEELADWYAALGRRYANYADRLPPFVGKELRRQLDIFAEWPEYFDFALLDVAGQKKLLLRLNNADPKDKNSLLAACRKANEDLLRRLETLSSARPDGETPEPSPLAAEFAPSRLAGILREACTGAPSPQNCLNADLSIGKKVLQAFSLLDYHYAILWDDDF
ncbi:MAG: hypothetical protein AAF975_03405 [Spirochaetota bacterium]